MYDTAFIVKYKSIEEELLEKVKNGEQDYSEDDIYTICNELYKHELLSVFQVENITDPKVEQSIIEIWEIVKQNKEFMQIIKVYRETIPLYNIFIDEKDLIGLLIYDIFFLTHICICKCLQNEKIDKELLHRIIEKINQI